MRVFYGISLPEAIRRKTAALAEAAAGRIPGRYALPENHHLTLAFLGDVAPELIPDVQAVLARTITAFSAPKITVQSFGHFGRMQNTILILHAGSEPALEPLNAALRAALAQADLPFDPGPFSPHITLARHAALDAGTPLPFAPFSFTAREAHLFLSARDDENTLRYTPIFSAPFANYGI